MELTSSVYINQCKSLRVGEPTEPSTECNKQYQESHFKYRTSPPKTIPVDSAIMERINHHSIDNGVFDVHPSEFPF